MERVAPHSSDGGEVQLHGGEAEGTAEIDVGGDVVVDGGLAFAGSGGSIRMTTAKGISSSSGDALLATANAGVQGVSGTVQQGEDPPGDRLRCGRSWRRRGAVCGHGQQNLAEMCTLTPETRTTTRLEVT